jgi:hypothetical protein
MERITGTHVYVAAVVATKKTTPATSGKGKRATRGYHASEHINNYYRTTKV